MGPGIQMTVNQGASRRSWEIDALRGLMLVLMTLTHLPTRLTDPLGQPFGFVSAAEGFVLLSAYMAGLVYSRLAYREGIVAMERAFWKRAFKVYLIQAAILFDGRLSSWWMRIVVGALLLVFILLQRALVGRARH